MLSDVGDVGCYQDVSCHSKQPASPCCAAAVATVERPHVNNRGAAAGDGTGAWRPGLLCSPHFDRVSENLRRTPPLACLSHYPDHRHHIMVTIVASPHGLLKAGGAEARTDMMLYLSIHLFRALSIWDIETLNDA